jgi:hypothetical protein
MTPCTSEFSYYLITDGAASDGRAIFSCMMPNYRSPQPPSHIPQNKER